ncbi:DMT family transporter [Brackiella oedipodis]|uniref:DMT family transporter n=1 Tax=Brackiella oedipodis TaxID=124225 RepID=UPI00048F1CF0|nr:DMT family transporter [Brackiella oedipodis]
MSLSRFNSSHASAAALWMVLSGMAFAAINVITPSISEFAPTFDSSWIAFYQYFFAFLLLLPSLLKHGFTQVFATEHFMTHFWRIVIAVIGIQFWVKALTLNFPIGEGVALLMTSPLFASLGAILLLKEKASKLRVIATFTGFLGALIILEPKLQNFSVIAVFPLLAAFCWAMHSVLLKFLSNKDNATTMVAYMYLLMIPINFAIASFTDFGAIAQPFRQGQSQLLLSLILLALLTCIGQYAIAKAYALADALFTQPFDYLKLPLNVLLGYLFFGWGVSWQFWLGAVMMVLSLLAISYYEGRAGQAR